MKCKKCGATMTKRSDVKHIYYFVCPKCGNEVSKKKS
jgi:DNA-directed RNA polymerase subunit M/transcription elongation factor TFIIS